MNWHIALELKRLYIIYEFVVFISGYLHLFSCFWHNSNLLNSTSLVLSRFGRKKPKSLKIP